MRTDELTGVQALERKHPGLPMAPGKVERREFEYIRHGTRSFIISRDVARLWSHCAVPLALKRTSLLMCRRLSHATQQHNAAIS